MSDKILWSDESNFHLFGSRRQFVRKRSNEKLHKGCVAKTKKYGGDHILVWGCFSRKGVGILRCITGNLNSDGYLELLQTAMLPSARTMFPDGDFIYQQDSAIAIDQHLSESGLMITTSVFWTGLPKALTSHQLKICGVF